MTKSTRPNLTVSTTIEPIVSLEEDNQEENFSIVKIPAKLLRRLVSVEGSFISESESEPKNIIIVDATGAWTRRKKHVICYQSAKLVYGKSSFEEAIENTLDLKCIVIFKGEYLQQRLKPSNLSVSFGTSTERLEVSEEWHHLIIRSDVFFIHTWRGYAPSILVESERGEIFHLIVGAKSLSSYLELMRANSGKIIDIPISVRRLGAEKTSVYEIRQRKA